jgi:hypothetical protein
LGVGIVTIVNLWFDPSKEGNSKRRKCGMCCFGNSYSVRSSKKEYERNLLMVMIESQQK